MPLLQVKDFPEDIYEQLRACAKEENRSISQQTITIIQSYLEQRERPAFVPSASQRPRSIYSRRLTEEEIARNRERRRKVLERIEERGPLPLPEGYESAADLVRECREERDAQIWANITRNVLD